MNDGSKSEPFFDNIFKLLAGIAFVSWMIQEYILPHNKLFLFLAIVCGLADVFYLFGHKILPGNRILVALNWAGFCLCIWLIYRNPGKSVEGNIAPVVEPDVTLESLGVVNKWKALCLIFCLIAAMLIHLFSSGFWDLRIFS